MAVWFKKLLNNCFPNLINSIVNEKVSDLTQRFNAELSDASEKIQLLKEFVETKEKDFNLIKQNYENELENLISNHDMDMIQEASVIRSNIEEEKATEINDLQNQILELEDFNTTLSSDNDMFRKLLEKLDIEL